MTDTKPRDAGEVALDAVTVDGWCDFPKVPHVTAILTAWRAEIEAAARADERRETLNQVLRFIKTFATAPGRSFSIYTLSELSRAIRDRFEGATQYANEDHTGESEQ